VSHLVKSVLREFGYEAGIEICRGYMKERLRLVTPSDLYEAIKDGTHSMGVSETKDKQFAAKWVKIVEKLSFKGQRLTRDKLTAANVLEWLKVDRPDLGSLLLNMGEEGHKWLKEDVEQVYNFLFPPSNPTPKLSLTLVKKEVVEVEKKQEEEKTEPEPAEVKEETETQPEIPQTEEKTSGEH